MIDVETREVITITVAWQRENFLKSGALVPKSGSFWVIEVIIMDQIPQIIGGARQKTGRDPQAQHPWIHWPLKNVIDVIDLAELNILLKQILKSPEVRFIFAYLI